jgi:hypothetical protein
LKEGYNDYIQKVYEDYLIIKKIYPLLKILILPPLNNRKKSFLYGKLIPKKIFDLCRGDQELLEDNSLEIIGIYPDNFPEKEIEIKDRNKIINWGKVEYEHWHFNANNGTLCTHHPNGRIKELKFEDRSLAVLDSAWNIFVSYKNNNWEIPELKHGYEGTKQLKREGHYHE